MRAHASLKDEATTRLISIFQCTLLTNERVGFCVNNTDEVEGQSSDFVRLIFVLQAINVKFVRIDGNRGLFYQSSVMPTFS